MTKHFVLGLFFVSFLTLFAVSVVANRFISFSVSAMEHNIDHRMISVAEYLAASISAEELDKYTKVEDMELQSYKNLRLKLLEFSKKADILYAYFIRPVQDSLQYIVDNDFNEKTRVGLDTPPYDARPLPWMLAALEGQSVCSGLGNYTPDWEGLLSGYAPIFDKDGNVKAIAGVDIKDEDILFARRMISILTVVQIISVLLVFISGLVSLIRFYGESRAKSKFLASMSHEIRTPMNAVIGMAEVALRKDMPNDIRKDIVTIKQAGNNLLSIINDILDISKIESGKLEIVPIDYMFSALINDVANIIKMRITNPELKFDINIDGNIPNTLFGDEARIRQVLLNVLSNAVKYTKKGFVSFSICGERTGDTVLLTMKVADSGIGIKKEDLEKLFNDFVQLNKSSEGVGLGLAITKKFVTAMGGDISVQSEYGKGSTFTIRLPQKIRSAKELSDSNTAVKFNAPNAKILVVDDNDTNLKVADGLMQPYKMQIDLRLSGAEAIEAVAKNSYDIVFMDQMMPEMDGIEAAKLIRKNYPDLPIVALTANAVSGTKEMFLANGFNDFLSKPIDTVKLNAILEKWLPKEKQKKAAETERESYSKADFEIDGVDVEKGVAALDGNLKLYMEILTAFYKSGANRIDEIKKCLEADNYSLYTTYVHALKGASASIGAFDLSEMAKSLETADKQADFAYIKQHNPEFLNVLEVILDNISKVLKDEPKVPIDFEALKMELSKLKKAIDLFDSDAIDEATNSLRAFAQVAAVENILKKTLTGKHKEVVAMIDDLMK